MNTIERQELRLNILKKLCEVFNFDMNDSLDNHGGIGTVFPDIEHKELLSNISYLKEKGYIEFDPFKSCAMETFTPMRLGITGKTVDLIEKIEAKMSTEKYEQDFSSTALYNFTNVSHSNIIVQSPGASITITNNEGDDVLKYLNDLLIRNNNHPALKSLVSEAEEKIKNNKATKDYLHGIGMGLKVFMNMGMSIASNLLTPKVAGLLGIVLENVM